MEHLVEIDAETLAAIDEALASIDDPMSEAGKLYLESRAKWDAITRPILEELRKSESIGPEDLRIVINVR